MKAPRKRAARKAPRKRAARRAPAPVGTSAPNIGRSPGRSYFSTIKAETAQQFAAELEKTLGNKFAAPAVRPNAPAHGLFWRAWCLAHSLLVRIKPAGISAWVSFEGAGSGEDEFPDDGPEECEHGEFTEDCKKCGRLCRHGELIGECDYCDHESDRAFDAAREDRVFGRGR